MVNIITISVLAVLMITFATFGLTRMTKAYFMSGLYGGRESIEKRLGKVSVDSLYRHIRELDAGFNTFNPLFNGELNEQDNKEVWAYNIVIDSVGTYIYHPDRQRIGRGNFYNDIQQSPDHLRQELESGLMHNEVGSQKITVDGESSYIFYVGAKDSHWKNAIIVPKGGLLIPLIATGLILLTIIIMGLLAAYWVSRSTIRRSTLPLRLLAKSAGEVAKGNFQNTLPSLKHNDEISELRDSFGHMQQSLTLYIDQLKTTTAQKAAMENELSMARDIQLKMVPTEFPVLDGYEIYASMTPAKAVGGDLYDWYIQEGEKLCFCIGDVSGKGVPAALYMTVVTNLFRAYTADEDMPDRIVSHINHVLSMNNDSCMFTTLFVGILDLQSGLLRYCNAGHEAPVVIGGAGVRELPVQRCFPVGPLPDATYETQEVVIEPQSSILFYTDGLNEATSADLQLFGEERILDEADRAVQAGETSPKALIERMTQAVHHFVGDAEQSDDLTMMGIRRV